MTIFLRRHHFESLRSRIEKYVRIGYQCLILLIVPLIVPLVTCTFWTFFIDGKPYRFSEKMEVIVTAGCLAIFGILYSIIVGGLINTTTDKYFKMREAVKKYDVEKFVDLRDEGISPVMYALVTVLSMCVLGSFMTLEYPNAEYARVVIGEISYVLGLIFFVVWEIDDPCSGLWYIRSLHPEWKEIDCRLWRQTRHSEERLKFQLRFRQHAELRRMKEIMRTGNHAIPLSPLLAPTMRFVSIASF